MIRDYFERGSRRMVISFTAQREALVQQRRFDWEWNTTAPKVDNVSVSPSVPVWLRLSKTGNNLTAFYSNDGVNWTQVGSSATIDFGDYFMIGLAVTSHADGQFATATFDNIQIVRR
jgi:beta-xylosidase